MSACREIFFNALQTVENIVSEQYTIDDGLGQTVHNSKAEVLRNGVAVVIFNSMELFLKDRYAEVVENMSSSRIRFSDFPIDLQIQLTYKSLLGLSAKLKYLDDSDKVSGFNAAIAKLGSNLSPSPKYSEFGFGYERSNLIADDIKNVTKAFLVKNGWDKLRLVSARAGLSRPSPSDDFKFVSSKRHQAAHNYRLGVPSQDLKSCLDIARSIAISFDYILTSSLVSFLSENTLVSVKSRIDNTTIKFRFIDQESPTDWREHIEGGTRTSRKHATKDNAIFKASQTAERQNEFIIVRNKSRIPVEWYFKI